MIETMVIDAIVLIDAIVSIDSIAFIASIDSIVSINSIVPIASIASIRNIPCPQLLKSFQQLISGLQVGADMVNLRCGGHVLALHHFLRVQVIDACAPRIYPHYALAPCVDGEGVSVRRAEHIATHGEVRVVNA